MGGRVKMSLALALLTLFASGMAENEPRDYQPYDMKKVDIIPSDDIRIYEGENLLVRLSASPDNFTGCSYRGSHTPDDLNTDQSGMEGFPKLSQIFAGGTYCPILFLNVDNETNPYWQITAVGEPSVYGNLTITVVEYPEVLDREYNLVAGESASLKFGPEESVYCRLIDPHGVMVAQTYGPCEYEIRSVYNHHQGNWTAEVGLVGSTKLYPYIYNVAVEGDNTEIVDIGEIQSSFELKNDSNINSLFVLCSVRIARTSSCRLEREDGTVFLLTPGLGTDRYSYYGNGTYQDENGDTFVDCGIQVDIPEEKDLKWWRCVMSYGPENTEINSTINIALIDGGDDGNRPHNSTDRVMQLAGKGFEMLCSTQDPIDYCWFQSPNKTIYVPLENSTNSEYEYYGNGLNSGECGIRFTSADVAQTGAWSCNMATSGPYDIKKNIDVKIYGSGLVTFYKIEGKRIMIGCRSYDNSSMDYCRFVRPDGKGIRAMNGVGRYYGNGTDLSIGSCRITMEGTIEEDFGTWTCAAKSSLVSTEYTNTLRLTRYNYTYNNSFGWVFISWLFYTIIIIGLVVAVGSLIHRTKVVSRVHRRARSFRNSFRSEKQIETNV